MSHTTPEQVRLDIQSGLQAYLSNYYTTPGYSDFLVIESNSGAPEPNKPYMVMHAINTFIREPGQPVETWESDGRDVKETHRTNPTRSTSFTVFCDIQGQDAEIGQRACDWFLKAGYEYLRSKGLAVEKIGNLENRDTYLIDQVERKVGFDVTVRFSHEIQVITGTIETVELVKK